MIISMEVDASFDLFKDCGSENAETILPLISKCIATSTIDKEILRSLETGLCVCVRSISLDELEERLFRITCPAAKNFVECKVNSLKENPEKCVDCLDLCLEIVAYFQRVFEYLKVFQKISFTEVKSFLIASCEVLFIFFSHCNISREVYGSFFSNLTNYLSNVFKKCCDLLDHLLSFLTDKASCDVEDESEISLLNEVATFLSKCGILLITLEAKTMAKVWKTYVFLCERYLSCFKDNPNIAEMIQNLSSSITTTANSDRDLKLSCFLLKLIIKLLEVLGCCKTCEKPLLNLLLRLCKCNLFLTDKEEAHQGLINQLTLAAEPLLSQLMMDVKFVKECQRVCENVKESPEFSVLCCLALKKLIHGNSTLRSLWFNKEENILMWIFTSLSSSKFITATNIHLPSVVISGKQMKYTDLYEYVFVTTSSFLMTATAEEYCITEKILFENILQENPMRALFAVDIWCLLGRFADSELCFSQMVTLGKTFQKFHPKTPRVEKLYLASLIRRLYPLLTATHRRMFLKFFQPSFYSTVWRGCDAPDEIDIQQLNLNEIHRLLDENDFEPEPAKRQNATCERYRKVVRLWKFNCDVLSSSFESVKFFKIVCDATASLVSDIPSDDLLLILTQMKRLLRLGQPTSVKLYFLRILNSLSTVCIPPGNSQKTIFSVIGELFRDLLSSKEILLKLKAFEVFYSFSHVTTHGEVIGLSVQNASELKLEITNYFKKIVPDVTDFSLSDYVGELYQLTFEHVCPEVEPEKAASLGPVVQETAKRWKSDAKIILEHFRLLPEIERNEIKNLCDSLLSCHSDIF